jgi:peptide/nickel transport system permease protein
MLQYIVRRVLLAVPTVIVISMLSFLIISASPGNFMDDYAAQLAQQGEQISDQQLKAMENAYGLNQPVYVQYFKWVKGIVTKGDFGQSLEWKQPVSQLIWGRLGWTVFLALMTLVVTWIIAIPIGIYSATHQYSRADYTFTTLGFIGLGIPGFMLALALMWIGVSHFGLDVGGLFSQRYQGAPWSFGKLADMLKHLWIPLLVGATEGTAGLIRVLRANLLDEMHKPYVTAVRARGLDERTLTVEYPVRVALNPIVSSIGFALPDIISGGVILSVVLSLPTIGPLLLNALTAKDMYLAGTLILLVGILTIVGTLLSDILLAWLDPRIRYEAS